MSKTNLKQPLLEPPPALPTPTPAPISGADRIHLAVHLLLIGAERAVAQTTADETSTTTKTSRRAKAVKASHSTLPRDAESLPADIGKPDIVGTTTPRRGAFPR